MRRSIALSPLELNPSNSLRREPRTPPHRRSQNYEQQYDDLTVFYDCFYSADGQATIMLGPPLFNLKRTLLRALRKGFDLRWYSHVPVRRHDRNDQVRMPPIGAVRLPAGIFRQQQVIVQPNLSGMFAGRRVVFTMSRDNELHWIKDWAHFFTQKHGADAILIYDNASTKYTSDDLREVLSAVPGLAVSIVVDWPYKLGSIGIEGQPWDSDFGQYGLFEHARYQFLAQAKAVVNADVDEFPLTTDGEPLFDIVLRSDTGYLQYRGQWVENASSAPEAKTSHRRHKHYFYRAAIQPPDNEHVLSMQKWTVDPARCPARAQWRVHLVTGMAPDVLSSRVRFRHFRAITVNWRDKRWAPELPNELDHIIDRDLSEWMSAFD